MATYKKPTKDDAEILLRLMKMNDTPQMEEAMDWFDSGFKAKTHAEFKEKYPEGSPGAKHFNRVMTQFELAGALVSHGILNENLYFDVSGIGFIWEKLGPIVEGARKEMSPMLWENAAWLAERQKKWSRTVWKPDMAWKRAK